MVEDVVELVVVVTGGVVVVTGGVVVVDGGVVLVVVFFTVTVG